MHDKARPARRRQRRGYVCLLHRLAYRVLPQVRVVQLFGQAANLGEAVLEFHDGDGGRLVVGDLGRGDRAQHACIAATHRGETREAAGLVFQWFSSDLGDPGTLHPGCLSRHVKAGSNGLR